MNVIPTMAELRRRVQAAFDRTLLEPLPGRAPIEYERWLNLSAAVAVIARASDAELRTLAAEAKRIGFNKPNRDDAEKAQAKLVRWAKLLG
jgi:hypothetical protein